MEGTFFVIRPLLGMRGITTLKIRYDPPKKIKKNSVRERESAQTDTQKQTKNEFI